MSRLRDNLRDVGRLQTEIKRRAMIFNCELKEGRAEALGLPYWAFYHMAFKDLHLIEDDSEARQWFVEHGTEAAAEEAASYAGHHAPDGMVEELKAKCLEESLKYVGANALPQLSEPTSS